ncbi:WD40-repeat-containing domain protein [Scenedesmus sp. NREL 46B-D3]|nr:WD40-repeat-containing domain protein [Scenedesmus sp. NREL 46B-D3]
MAAAAAGTKYAHCCSRARVDYNTGNSCYVFKAIRSPDSSAVAASLSNNAIKLYSCSPSGLSHVADIPAHSTTISDVQFPFDSLPQALYSCSRDGHVKAWDLRSRQLAESYQAHHEELYAFSVSDNLVAAGGQGDVHFWDRRTQQQLASFDDMHMDDVTQVLFHAASSKLITASADGLVAVHDVAGGLEQDDGFIAALNVGTSVEQLGLYGSEGQHMWCRTGTETLQLWDWLAAAAEDAVGGDVAVADLAEARQMAAAAAGASSAAALFGEVDYLIGCHWDSSSGQLLLVAGTISGAVAFFPIAEQQHRAGQLPPGSNLLQPPAVVLNGCHRDIVRSIDCFSGAAAQRLLCVSAGEDAQLALWTLDQAAAAAPSSSEDSAGPSRRQKQQAHSSSLRRSPY